MLDTSILREDDKLQFPYVPRLNPAQIPLSGIFKSGCMPRIDNQWLPYIVGALEVLQQKDVWLGTEEEIEAAIEQISLVCSVLYDDSIQCGEVVYMGVPVGSVMIWVSDTAIPDGWLPCIGSVVDASEYPELAIALGVTGETFQLPNMAGLVPMGVNPEGAFGGYSEIELGDVIGEVEHTLTVDEIPSHSHSIALQGATGTSLAAITDNPRAEPLASAGATSAVGSGVPHNNIQPSMGVWFIIKAVPDEPINQTVIGGNMYRLRQHPEEPCKIQQSINGGASYTTVFDYDLCFGGLKSITSQIAAQVAVNNTVNNYNNVQTIINNYGGDVLNIYPDAEYGDANDNFRDAALCYALNMIMEVLKETLAQAIEDKIEQWNEGLRWGKLVNSVMSIVAAGGAVWAIGALTNPAFALGLVLAGVGLELADILGDIDNEDRLDELRDYDLSPLACCIYTTLKGATINETDFIVAFSDCLVDFPNTLSEEKAIRTALVAMSTSRDLFANLVSFMGSAFSIQENGVSLPACGCESEICESTDFRSGLDGYTLSPLSVQNETDGIRGTVVGDTYNAARVTKDIGVIVSITSASIEWYAPRNDDSQYASIQVSINGVDWTSILHRDYRSIGFHTENWSGSVFARYIRFTATGTLVNTRSGQVRQASYCYLV